MIGRFRGRSGALLLLVALATAAAALVIRLEPAGAAPAPSMGIDPDRGGPAAVGGTASVGVGASVQVGIHVISTDVAYQAYQVRLEYDDAVLDMVNVPAEWSANNTWPPPGGSCTFAGPVGPF